MLRAVAAGAVIALGAGGLLLSATPASAAEVPVSLSNTQLRITGPNGEPVADGQTLSEGGASYFTTDFALSVAPAPGDSFSIPIAISSDIHLPAAPFPLQREDGTTVGTCSYAATPTSAITCVFNDEVEPGDQEGFLWFTVTTGQVGSDTSAHLSVDGFSIDFTIENSDQGGETPWAPTPLKKYGWSAGGGRSGYSIELGEAGSTLNGLQTVTIADRLTTGSVVDGATTINLLPHTFVADSFTFSCFAPGAMMSELTRQPWPATWTPVFNDAKTEFSLVIDVATEGLPCGDFSRMQIAYETEPVGSTVQNTPGASTVYGYGNAVDIEGFQSTASAVAYTAGGGGVSNTDVLFSIIKAVDGDAAASVAPGTVFEVEVQVSGEAAPRVITFSAESASFSGPIPDGRTITIREINLPIVAGVEWSGSPTLTGDTVVDNGDGTFSIDPAGGQQVSLVLTNTAAPVIVPQFGSLTVTKAIAADSAPAPADVTYGFEVVCTGVDEPYTGSAAAGRSFTVDGIPAGAVCDVTETQSHGAAAIDYSASAITIVSGETAQITVTNSFDTPPVPPHGSQDVPPGELALTGGDLDGPLVAVAGAALLLMIGLTLVARRRARTE